MEEAPGTFWKLEADGPCVTDSAGCGRLTSAGSRLMLGNSLFVISWMDLESVIQSEVSQKEKNKYHYANVHVWNLKIRY